MNNIRCILIDDEPPAIELLEKYASMVDLLEVVDTCNSAVKAFSLLKEKTIDLIFLDIQMPVLNGLDFIKTLQHPPAIILTTAYREYALDGYDLNIIDYLLKPIPFDRFLKAVDRYRERMVLRGTPQNPIEKPVEHLFLNVNRTRHKVLLTDILYIESLKDYVRVHTRKTKLVVKGNLGSFMKKLPADGFVRIHRSFAVAIPYVTAYNQMEATIEGEILPIGASYRDGFMDRIG